MEQQNSEYILGYSIATLSKEECVEEILKWVESGQRCKYFVCANPHSLGVARSDGDFQKALRAADLVTPDGVGVLIASRILGGRIRSRVTGSDIFEGLSRALNEKKGYKYFFLGSTEKNLSLIRAKMKADFPNIDVAGTFSPPFKSEFTAEENLAMIQAVNDARPHVLWVGMTAPKQEKWIYQNRDLLNVNAIGAVGAVFDFYVGTIKRSNPWFLDHGLEWLPRLLQDPRRLWYRSAVSGPAYILRAVADRLLTKPQR